MTAATEFQARAARINRRDAEPTPFRAPVRHADVHRARLAFPSYDAYSVLEWLSDDEGAGGRH